MEKAQNNCSLSMVKISSLLKKDNSGRHDQNFLKTFDELSNEAMTKIRGHKNQTITFFTFKRN